MSTRSAIARWTDKEDKTWEGRYHHWDGYPSALGNQLFRLYKNRTLGDLPDMLKTLLDDHPAGWRTIVNADWELKPGFVELSNENVEDLRRGPQCYCHGDRQERANLIESGDEINWNLEWAYVFDEPKRIMTILCQHSGHWVRVRDVDLDGNEPDWNEIQGW